MHTGWQLGKDGSKVFQPLKDTAECSFLSAINDAWSSMELWEIGQPVRPSILTQMHQHTYTATTQTSHNHTWAHAWTKNSLPPSLRACSHYFFFFFSWGFAEIVHSFIVSPPDRKDLNSTPVHANKRAGILLTAYRSLLPFTTAS